MEDKDLNDLLKRFLAPAPPEGLKAELRLRIAALPRPAAEDAPWRWTLGLAGALGIAALAAGYWLGLNAGAPTGWEDLAVLGGILL